MFQADTSCLLSMSQLVLSQHSLCAAKQLGPHPPLDFISSGCHALLVLALESGSNIVSEGERPLTKEHEPQMGPLMQSVLPEFQVNFHCV